jgi:hypothetical protein
MKKFTNKFINPKEEVSACIEYLEAHWHFPESMEFSVTELVNAMEKQGSELGKLWLSRSSVSKGLSSNLSSLITMQYLKSCHTCHLKFITSKTMTTQGFV